MSDPKHPSNTPDVLRDRLGLGGTSPAPTPGGDVAPPAFGGGGEVPPPALGGDGVPPPAFGGSNVPAPDLGLAPQLDVAPPPFMAKKKKKRIEKKQVVIEEEVYVDAGEIIDPKAAGRRRITTIVCVVLALPLFVTFFWVGKSRQNWALEDRSRENAGTLLEKMTKAGPVLQGVQSRTAAALSRAQANEIDEEYITFTQNVAKQRPLSNADFDMLNYAAFEPVVVDRLYELNRLLEVLWGKMASHRNLTRNDLNALKAAPHMDVPATQTRFGVALMNIYEDVYGVNIGVISNPGQDADGHRTLDLQVRPGRLPALPQGMLRPEGEELGDRRGSGANSAGRSSRRCRVEPYETHRQTTDRNQAVVGSGGPAAR